MAESKRSRDSPAGHSCHLACLIHLYHLPTSMDIYVFQFLLLAPLAWADILDYDYDAVPEAKRQLSPSTTVSSSPCAALAIWAVPSQSVLPNATQDLALTVLKKKKRYILGYFQKCQF